MNTAPTHLYKNIQCSEEARPLVDLTPGKITNDFYNGNAPILRVKTPANTACVKEPKKIVLTYNNIYPDNNHNTTQAGNKSTRIVNEESSAILSASEPPVQYEDYGFMDFQKEKKFKIKTLPLSAIM